MTANIVWLLIYKAMVIVLLSVARAVDGGILYISIEMMSDVSVIFEMIMVRNRIMTCDAEVSDIIARIIVC